MDSIQLPNMSFIDTAISHIRKGLKLGKLNRNSPEKYMTLYHKAFNQTKYSFHFQYEDYYDEDGKPKGLVSAAYHGGTNFMFYIGPEWLNRIYENDQYADRFKLYFAHEYTHYKQDSDGQAFSDEDFNDATDEEIEMINLASKIEVEAIAVETILAEMLNIDDPPGLKSYSKIFATEKDIKNLHNGIEKIKNPADLKELYITEDEVLNALYDKIKNIEVKC
jgi:hypothetical protein